MDEMNRECIERGLLVVISGPSASGKGTVNRYVLENEDFVYSVSATTRQPRAGEVDGVNYHFTTKENFERLIRENEVLEYTQYCENYYGTLRAPAEKVLSAGKNLILEIEVEGAAQIREKYPDAVFIMLLPPSFREQEARLRNRQSEDEETIQRRLRQTRREMKCVALYDYIVYNRNGQAKEAAEEILAIVKAEKCSRRRISDVARRYFECGDRACDGDCFACTEF